jgi:hypothetical protein
MIHCRLGSLELLAEILGRAKCSFEYVVGRSLLLKKEYLHLGWNSELQRGFCLPNQHLIFDRKKKQLHWFSVKIINVKVLYLKPFFYTRKNIALYMFSKRAWGGAVVKALHY